MELIGAVTVFLLGACTGLLVLLSLQGARRNQLAEHAAEQAAHAAVLAEQHHREQRTQLLTMTKALVDRMQLIGADLAAEMRDVNAASRNDLRIAAGLPPVVVPGEPPSTRRATRATSPPASRTTPTTPATSRSPVREAPLRAADEPTPPSGWTLEQVRAHIETAGEDHPR